MSQAARTANRADRHAASAPLDASVFQRAIRHPWAVALGAAVVALVLYAPTFDYDFVYDDVSIIVDDARLDEPMFFFKAWVSPWWPGGSGDQLSFAQLAVARSIYTRSSMLLTKHVSLDVQYGDTGEVVRVGPESVVRDLLEVSEEQARRAIGALKRDGVDATTCIQIYHIARTYEGRVPEDRIEALEYYFATNVTAQILRHLAGKTRKPRR